MRNCAEANEFHFTEKMRLNGLGTPQSLSWGSTQSQEIRFEQLLRIFNLEGKTLLDVGCGYGDLFRWLEKRDIHLKKYVGIDVCQHNIDFARQLAAENCEFILGEFLKTDVPSVDVAFLSGSFNLDYADWQNVTLAIVEKMIEMSTMGMAFNLESSWGIPPEKLQRINRNYDPLFWIDVIRKKTKRFCFFHDYHDADFTIGMYHETD